MMILKARPTFHGSGANPIRLELLESMTDCHRANPDRVRTDLRRKMLPEMRAEYRAVQRSAFVGLARNLNMLPRNWVGDALGLSSHHSRIQQRHSLQF
jgi:hypothetical protein